MARRAGSLNIGSLATSRTVTWATSRAARAQAVPSSPTWVKKSTKPGVSPVCSSMRGPPRAGSVSWTLPMSVPVTARVWLSTAFRRAPRLPDPDRWAEVKARAGFRQADAAREPQLLPAVGTQCGGHQEARQGPQLGVVPLGRPLHQREGALPVGSAYRA